jgi:proteasome assembly chaperone (PAC2) family protein
VRRVIVVAGYGLQGADVCGAATSPALMEELKARYGVDVGYEGPFYGFSGLVFGLAQRKGLDAVCLFGRTEPTPDFPESPDEAAAHTLLQKLAQLLNLPPGLVGDTD